MQIVEKNAVSLRALDGGLADLAIRPVFEGQQPSGTAVLAMRALARLVRASGAAIPVAEELPDSGPVASDAASEVASGRPSAGLRFDANLTTPAAGDGHSITRIRAFDPIVRAQSASLDIAIVTPETEMREPQSRASRSLSLGYDDSTVDLACRYATRFGRHRVRLVLSSHPSPVDVHSVGVLVDSYSDRYPELELEIVAMNDLVRPLLSGSVSPAVVVAAPAFGDTLREIAAQVSGASSLTTVSRVYGDTVSVGADTRCVSPAGNSGLSTRPSALVLAIVDLLVWLGREEAALRILNGWLRTLEYGCHTDEISLMRPAARMLDADELADAVIERLESKPRTLRPRFVGVSDNPTTARKTNHLRLV